MPYRGGAQPMGMPPGRGMPMTPGGAMRPPMPGGPVPPQMIN
jgi:hypothetical protein